MLVMPIVVPSLLIKRNQIHVIRYRCLDLRRKQMNSAIILRHRVVKLIRRYLEDVHGFVEVLSFEIKYYLISLYGCCLPFAL